jgi:hypothetical protein
MTKWLVTLLCCTVAATALAQTPAPQAPAAPASPPPEYPVLRVGMLSYLQYDAELRNRDAYNAFDVTRAYLNVNAQVAPNVRFRFTPDVKRVADGSLAGSMTVRVKYAFAQFDNVTPRGWVRLGMHQTPWLDFEEGINRYRVQGTMFAEREGLIPGSADVGAGYFSPLPHGFGEIQAGVYNGEGFAQAETNKYKSLQGRVTVRPMAGRGRWDGLRVSGFYSAGWYDAGRPRHLGIVMASFEQPHLAATFQHVQATDRPAAGSLVNVRRAGDSAFIELRQGARGWAGLARVDVYDADLAVSDNMQTRVIGGGGYWFVWPRSRLGLIVTGEQIHAGPLAGKSTENRLLFQTHVEF